MKQFLIISLAMLANLAIVAAIVAVDFCDEELCPPNVPHIGCGNSGLFSSECPPGAQLLNSDDFRGLILHLHNKYRNLAAAGVYKLWPACRMAVMEWCETLEHLAMFNVLKCNQEEDLCRNTPTGPNVGQNIFRTVASDPIEAIENIILTWFVEGNLATNETIDYYQNEEDQRRRVRLSHFATMVIDKNNRVGCALARDSLHWGKPTYYSLTCNYATAPVNYEPVYETCPLTRQACVTPANPHYPNLCEKDESPVPVAKDEFPLPVAKSESPVPVAKHEWPEPVNNDESEGLI